MNDLFCISGSIKLVKESDESHVIVRPKHYVGSTGCVWASDLMRLRYENPNMYEVHNNSNVSEMDRAICAKIHDNVYYFLDTTTDKDLNSLTKGDDFLNYEKKRINHMLLSITRSFHELESTNIARENLVDSVKRTKDLAEILAQKLSLGDTKYYIDNIPRLIVNCKDLLNLIDSLNLPPIKSVVGEYTDGGPGVGISNTAVRFR